MRGVILILIINIIPNNTKEYKELLKKSKKIRKIFLVGMEKSSCRVINLKKQVWGMKGNIFRTCREKMWIINYKSNDKLSNQEIIAKHKYLKLKYSNCTNKLIIFVRIYKDKVNRIKRI